MEPAVAFGSSRAVPVGDRQVAMENPGEMCGLFEVTFMRKVLVDNTVSRGRN